LDGERATVTKFTDEARLNDGGGKKEKRTRRPARAFIGEDDITSFASAFTSMATHLPMCPGVGNGEKDVGDSPVKEADRWVTGHVL